MILFKLAGPIFDAYAEPSVVDRCFHLLKSHTYFNPYHGRWDADSHAQARRQPLQVRAAHRVKDGHRAKTIFQEVIKLRERSWEGLPPPPIFTTGVAHRDGLLSFIGSNPFLPPVSNDIVTIPIPTLPTSLPH